MPPRSATTTTTSSSTSSAALPSVLLLLLLLLAPGAARAAGGTRGGNARLLTTDAAEVLERPVLGLQRTAFPLPLGLALDTSLLADLLLAANLGLRWGVAVGPHRVVLGARYTQFVGSAVYTQLLNTQTTLVRRFDATLSGPTAYALYGLSPAEGWLVQVEGRYWGFQFPAATVMAGLHVPLAGPLGLALEGGYQLLGRVGPRGAAGLRFQGDNLGFSVGAAYVDILEPMAPGGALPVIPTLDLSWTF